MRMTVGTSAPLMNQLSLDAIVRAGDQPPAAPLAASGRSLNLNVAFESACSSQLRITPFAVTVRLGCADCPVAGTCRGSTVTAHGASFGAAAFSATGAGASSRLHALPIITAAISAAAIICRTSRSLCSGTSHTTPAALSVHCRLLPGDLHAKEVHEDLARRSVFR